MLQPTAYGSERSNRRGASRWLYAALLAAEFIAAPALGQTTAESDKAQPAKPAAADAKPVAAAEEKPAAAAAATEEKPAVAETPAAPAEAKPAAAADAGVSAGGTVATSTAAAEDSATAADEPLPPEMLSVPGSPRPKTMGLAAESPNVPATIGGRAQSFGAPGPAGENWSFRFGGRVSGVQSFGLGRKPTPTLDGYQGTAWHVPALTAGRGGIWAGAGLTLNMTYGNPTISANVNYYVNLNGQAYRGYYSPQAGPQSGQAYLALNPPKLGNLQLAVKVGAFTETYGGVGQWGWGIMGPLMGLKGYGEVVVGDLPLSKNYRFWFSHGFSAVPGLPENMPRGDYSGWVEPAISSLVHHAHIGINASNNHALKLHYARIYGVDERQVLNGTKPARDGHMDIYVGDLRTRQEQWGHFAVAGAYYDVKNGNNINDGLWWGIDWTQGATTQVSKFIGIANTGTGSYYAISAQWDFSLARMLWHPRNFDGRHPDIRGGIAGLYHATVKTDDPLYDGANGYTFGSELEYVFLPWLGVFFRGYVESRDVRKYIWVMEEAPSSANLPTGSMQFKKGDSLERFDTKCLMPGLMFRSDWSSTDSIQLAYQRRFYNDVSDPNPTAPMDEHVFTIGATASF